jgi:murein DD-endopeptidase MepM/ murein hydrolase activator NlpD
MILGIFICIFIGGVWIVFKYGDICQKTLKIRALKSENRKLRQKHQKLQQFEEEFNEFKNQLIKISRALDVKKLSSPPLIRASFNPEDSFPDLSALSEELYIVENKEVQKIPSLYPVDGWISQKFSASHPAVDIAAKYESPVFSTIDGEVKFIGEDSSLGKVIKITSGEIEIIYGHLAKIVVEEKQKVRPKDLIGYVGLTGKSSAPHLHYEVRINGIPYDPERYLVK